MWFSLLLLMSVLILGASAMAVCLWHHVSLQPSEPGILRCTFGHHSTLFSFFFYCLGMMELSYTQHYSTSGSSHAGNTAGPDSTSSSSSPPADITFTATASGSGSLLIGDLKMLYSAHAPLLSAS
jgi:hypothetical protein